MCPAIEKYLVPYIDKNRQPIRIDDRIAADIKKNAREVLAIARRGSKVIFPTFFKSTVDWKSSFDRLKGIDCPLQAHRKRQVF